MILEFAQTLSGSSTSSANFGDAKLCRLRDFFSSLGCVKGASACLSVQHIRISLCMYTGCDCTTRTVYVWSAKQKKRSLGSGPYSMELLVSLLLGFVILDLQDLLLPRFSGPSRSSQRLSWQRERLGVRRGSSRTLGDPPWGSLSLPGKSSGEPRGGPEDLGRRRVPEVRDTEPK